jgi:hypothetical protein
MTAIELTNKAAKLMKLCDIEGFETLDALLQVAVTDSVCPAICMTEGCDCTGRWSPIKIQGSAKNAAATPWPPRWSLPAHLRGRG